MKLDIDLQKLLGAVNVPADWVGIREVYEAHTPRMIRDGVPVANSHALLTVLWLKCLLMVNLGILVRLN